MSVGVGVRGDVTSQARKRRDVAYESILSRTYTQDLKPGMIRKLGRVGYGSGHRRGAVVASPGGRSAGRDSDQWYGDDGYCRRPGADQRRVLYEEFRSIG